MSSLNVTNNATEIIVVSEEDYYSYAYASSLFECGDDIPIPIIAGTHTSVYYVFEYTIDGEPTNKHTATLLCFTFRLLCPFAYSVIAYEKDEEYRSVVFEYTPPTTSEGLPSITPTQSIDFTATTGM